MKFKKTQITRILDCSQATEDKWIDAINAACEKFTINTKLRLAAFIAQVGHESGHLSAVTENLNYSAAGLMGTWPSRFDTFAANACARNPEKIANKVYGGRMGNKAEGDGWKYRGRGLIQCTGKSNYDAFSQSCGVDAINNPDSLTQPTNASLSAGWFWNSKGLNAYADRGDFLTITKRINGGAIGQADREKLYKKAIIVLSDGALPSDDELAKKPVEVTPDTTAPISEQKTPAAQNSAIVEPRSVSGGATSKYPWNLVTESRSGHTSEIDDTPGNERVNVTHRTGSYWEFDRLGVFTIKSILDSYKLTKGDAYDFTGGNYTQRVKGQSYRQSSGDMIFKTEGQMYINANRVQVNTGMMAVSGEINAPSINATIFSGMGGLAFGDMLAKQALVAYDIIKGKAPMLGGSMGFKGKDGGGSADGAMSNNLSNKSPNGTAWVTNGVAVATAAVGVSAAAMAIKDILGSNDTSPAMSNALNSAAADANKQAAADASQTPVFLKHVTFDKPTLLSQSTTINKPDPSLYVNNYHTIVDAQGNGQLHMSNGSEWVPVGDPNVANNYTDAQIDALAGVVADNQVSNVAALVAEAQQRANAILNEATERANALVNEAQARQFAIEQGLLAEAAARGAAVTAESIIRQTEDESLSNHILTLTASTASDIAAAIQTEQQARTDAISAEATLRQTLAATVAGNTSSITDEITARSNADSALSTRITNYTASNDTALANVRTEVIAQVDGVNNALTTRIDAQVTANANNAASIITETNTRVSQDTALSTRIDTVTATAGNNASLIATEVTARTNADSALSSRIDVVLAKANDNTALISTESTTRANADSANATQIGVVSAVANGAATSASTANTAASNAQTAANNAQSKADTAFNNAATAQTAANTANTDLANIASDNVLSKGEKSQVILDWNAISDEQAGIDAQANTFGQSRTAYDNAVSALSTYLTSIAYSNTATDTAITGSTFRTKFSDVYSTRQALLNAIAARAKVLADGAQTAANTAQSKADTAFANAATAQTAANNAQTSANTANNTLANIASDNVLSMGEKPQVILSWNSIQSEATPIYNQGTNFGTIAERDDFNTKYTALLNYMNTLDWSTLTTDTAIVGTTFRAKFSDYYLARQVLLNAVATKAKTIADAKATVFRQSGAPTAKAVGDVWIDIGNQNRMKVWDGGSWIDVTDTRTTQNSADIVTERDARVSGDSANASLITTLTTTVNGHTSSISTNTSSINGLSAQYSVKVNNNGYVSGFGLSSTPVNGTPTSIFRIESDKFELVSSAGAVARMELTSQQLKIYDSSNVLRVRLGIW